MKTFKYWAKTEGVLVIDGVNTKAIFLGGSEISEQDARRNAIRKFEAVQRKINGVKKEFEEYEVEIREEQIKRISDSIVITRNRYGAHVLNVEDQMILDVDNPPTSFFDLFSRKTDDWKVNKLDQTIEKLNDHLNDSTLGFRLYKTCAGFRIIITGKNILPKDKLADHISHSLNVDPLYWHLCKKQNCYRARLTPKPYRIKYKPIKIKLPDSLERKEEINSWETGYLKTSQNYSVCKYIKTIGTNNITNLVSLHDEYTRATSDRNLA